MRSKTFAPLAALACLAALSFSAEDLDKNLERAFLSIRPMDPYNTTGILAGPEFAGRLTGHEGYTAAARWAAGKFREWGLKPLGAGEGYLQAYPSPYTVIDKAEMTLRLEETPGAAGKEKHFKEMTLQPEKEFLPLLFSDSGDKTAGLVFAGWGISAAELNYDDYAGLDVEDKFVLCFRGTPDQADARFQSHDEHRTRMKTAKDKGAAGLIYIYPEPASNPNGDWLPGFLPAQVSEKVADAIFKEIGVTAAGLKKDLAVYKRPLSFPLRASAHLAVESRHFPGGVGYNVVGWVEGSDPKLKKECLVIGGHFDHTGRHMGLLFPGADDNASGSAVVMEIAEAFSKLGRKPKRSVVFALFGGEEMGLQGSTYFVEHPPSVFSRTHAMFNFDMTGEGDGTGCALGPDSPELKRCLEQADRHVGTLRSTGVIRGVGVRSSDFAPFFLQGIPCVSFHSNGPHLHYHRTGDSIHRINPDMLADVSRLAFLTAYFFADE